MDGYLLSSLPWGSLLSQATSNQSCGGRLMISLQPDGLATTIATPLLGTPKMTLWMEVASLEWPKIDGPPELLKAEWYTAPWYSGGILAMAISAEG